MKCQELSRLTLFFNSDVDSRTMVVARPWVTGWGLGTTTLLWFSRPIPCRHRNDVII